MSCWCVVWGVTVGSDMMAVAAAGGSVYDGDRSQVTKLCTPSGACTSEPTRNQRTESLCRSSTPSPRPPTPPQEKGRLLSIISHTSMHILTIGVCPSLFSSATDSPRPSRNSAAAVAPDPAAECSAVLPLASRASRLAWCDARSLRQPRRPSRWHAMWSGVWPNLSPLLTSGQPFSSSLVTFFVACVGVVFDLVLILNGAGTRILRRTFDKNTTGFRTCVLEELNSGWRENGRGRDLSGRHRRQPRLVEFSGQLFNSPGLELGETPFELQ